MKLLRYLACCFGLVAVSAAAAEQRRLQRELDRINADLERAREPVILWRVRS